MTRKFLAILGSVLLLTPVLALSAVEGTDFSGTWKINPEKSEMGGGMGRRGGAGQRGGGGRGGGMAMEFSVVQDGNNLMISQGGSKYSVQIGADPIDVDSQMGAMTVAAKWAGSNLEVNRTIERKTPRGNMTIEETQFWTLSEDGQTLTQTVERNTPRGNQTVKMVYDRQ